jgi:hypothetical protein
VNSDKQGQAEQAAADLLAKFGVEEPPVDVEDLAKRLGAHIERRPHSPEISGLLYRDQRVDGERIVIGVNADDALVRQRFTIAHELGHLLLNHNEQLFVDRDLRVNLRAPKLHGHGGVAERQANWFAAALLMPEAMVRRVATELSEGRRPSDETLISLVAEQFAVSRQAMGYRLLNLGLLSGL